jgi:hypothetical protein
MMFNATFNNITAISWQSVLLVEETGVPGENPRYNCNIVESGVKHHSSTPSLLLLIIGYLP